MSLEPSTAETIRIVLVAGLLALIGTLEPSFPRRLSDPQRPLRWMGNFALVGIGTALTLAASLSATAAALWAERAELGLFNKYAWPAAVEFAIAWLFLDLALYAQHRAFHEIRWLWPWHRVHHSDVEFDVTTGLRFHPGEVLLVQAWKIATVLALGAPWLAVLVYDVALSSFFVFAHANLRLPSALDRVLRLLVITPEFHRVHHSVHRDEHDRNYGNLLSIWDRLFRSYQADPRDGHRDMRIGLPGFRLPAQQRVMALLGQPFEP
ncbi:MAG TPA: sterol desaturase family protein [Nevskiaceae bacterium]|nr:sterol desaturase family protein [Nevskiaceae bacterium]